MRRYLALAFIFCVAPTAGFAQSRLNGKWATDRPADPVTDSQRRQSVQLELNVEDAKASGSISLGGLGGNFYTFQDARLNGSKAQFRMDPSNTGAWSTWTIELVDDNTVMVSRGPIEIVGNNVLGLISAPGSRTQLAPAVPVASVTSPPANAGPSISGVVQDPSKANIPGVTVTATNIDTGTTLTTTTGEVGSYTFSNVLPGRYTMTASLSGFNTTTLRDLQVGNTELRQDLTLEFRTAQAPTVSSCSDRMQWCSILHRAK